MQARESIEGQRYVLPERIGKNVIGIQYGWNYSKEYILFLLERGEERIIKTIMPQEEIKNTI
jgi:hypothetical protein